MGSANLTKGRLKIRALAGLSHWNFMVCELLLALRGSAVLLGAQKTIRGEEQGSWALEDVRRTGHAQKHYRPAKGILRKYPEAQVPLAFTARCRSRRCSTALAYVLSCRSSSSPKRPLTLNASLIQVFTKWMSQRLGLGVSKTSVALT